jgi:NADP-dependent 3-hydroxy acid dehydrogenase YdfG
MTVRKALVIGASSGIGAATVSGLAALGWDVTAVARRADLLEDLAYRHNSVTATAIDVTDTAALENVVQECGPLDALIYEAGWNFPERELSMIDPIE